MPDSNPGSPRQTLYIIDTMAQIFRAYYAIRGGMNSPVTGEPTHAVFGIAGVMLKLFGTLKPDYVIMASDAPGPTFRDEIFKEYKANRPAAPEDLVSQIPRVMEMSRLFGVPVVMQSGAEADDVIATLVREVTADPAHSNIDIRIVSKDKDLEQLLGDRVAMFDIHTDSLLDVAGLKAEKGISPAQVIDVLALMGDNVDNVPGVDGIGPKTATALIHEFGSVENLYNNLDKIKGKRRENLEAARAIIPLSKTLVTLKSDLVLDFKLETAKAGKIDGLGLAKFFAEMGFRRHAADLDRLLGNAGPSAAPTESGRKAVKNVAAALASEAPIGGLFGQMETLSTTTSTKSSKPAAPAEPSLFGTDDAEAPIAGDLFGQGNDSSQNLHSGSARVVPEGCTTAAAFDYRAIRTRRELDELAATLSQQTLISVDTETVGLGHRAGLCGLSFAWKEGSGVYVPVLSPTPGEHQDLATVLSVLGPVLEDPRIGKCGHNLKYDLLVLRHAGVRVRGVAHDSMVASHLLGSEAHGLDHLALKLLKHVMIPISDLIGPESAPGRRQRTMDQAALELITSYAAEDADIALRLCRLFMAQLKLLGLEDLANRVEMPLVEVLAEMEFAGIRVDPHELSRQKQDLGTRIVDLRNEIEVAAGIIFNPDSPKQLAEFLFNRLGLPVIKKTRTGPSTDIEVLEKLVQLDNVDPQKLRVPKLIVEYRQLTKLVGTYLDNLRESISPKTGRIHATFHQTGAATGRLSSSGPNLQNIPIRADIGRQIRKAFLAEEGNLLVSADYSQIELRVLAHLSGDPNLKSAFEKGLDIHTAVAAEVFGTPVEQVSREQRAQAKSINFGIIYGISAFGLARQVEGLGIEGARKLISNYKKRFPGINSFLDECIMQAEQKGYVTTILGRRRSIPEISHHNASTRSLGERLAINTVVQGSAADLIKLAMVNLQATIDREKLPIRLLLQIHDELVIESPEAIANEMAVVVKKEMETAMTMKVPIKVDVGIGKDWFSAK